MHHFVGFTGQKSSPVLIFHSVNLEIMFLSGTHVQTAWTVYHIIEKHVRVLSWKMDNKGIIKAKITSLYGWNQQNCFLLKQENIQKQQNV